MKKTILKCFGSDSHRSSGFYDQISAWLVVVCMSIFSVMDANAASCTLGCHDANISLNENCQARINANMFLDGNGASCPGAANFTLTLRDGMTGPIIAQSGVLATGATLFTWTTASSWLNKRVVVEVRDGVSGNMCWANALVEDKFAPVISSCADVTLNCWETATWSPGFTDNCSAPVTTNLVDISSRPGDCVTEPGILRVLTRVYYASDANNNVSPPCTLRVFVKAAILSDITCSGDITVNCTDYPVGTNPAPSLTGVPSILSGGTLIPLWTPNSVNVACNIAVDYTDNLLQLTCGRERKIMRTWRYNIWNCGVDQMANCTQIITIRDIEAPTLSVPANSTLSTGAFNCTAPYRIPYPTVADNCGTVRVDVIYPGGARSSMPNTGWDVALPAGNNTITYRAYDDCGNSTQAIYTVMVQDQTKPVPVCVRNTVVALNEQGYGRLNASDIDNGSWDNCSVSRVAIRKMSSDACPDGSLNTTFRDFVTFCCAEVSPTNHVTVILRVYDAQGNFNDCMVAVEVQDKILPVVVGLPDLTVDCRYPFSNVGGTYNEFGMIRLPNQTRNAIITQEETPVYNAATGRYDLVRTPRNWGLDGYVQNGCINTVDAPSVTTNLSCGAGTITRTFIIRNASNTTTSTTQTITVASRNAFFGYDAAVMNSSVTGASNVTNVFNADRDRNVWEDPCKFYYISNPPALPLTPGPYLQVKWQDGKHDIYWPADAVLTDVPCAPSTTTSPGCAVASYPWDPCALDFYKSRPYIANEDGCSQILVSYEDEVFKLPRGSAGCTKILRQWKVVDWCRRFCAPTPQGLYYIDGSSGYAMWRYTQEIIIMNTFPPAVSATNITLTANDNCVSTNGTASATAIDDCATAEEIAWNWSLDIDNNGTYDATGVGNSITRNFTVGRHRVLWSAEDGCGNASTRESFINVIENKKPSPVCKTLVVELMPSTGTITIPASNFNDGSFDNCTPSNRLTYTISRLVPSSTSALSAPSSITFDCRDYLCSGGFTNDAGQEAPRFMSIYIIVTDEYGNWDYCRTGVMVQNNMGAVITQCNENRPCEADLLGRAVVGGSIQTEQGRNIELVDISLEGGNSVVQTSASGTYEFPAMNTGGSYSVVPQKLLAPRNGLSTADILLIQKHILGSEKLNTPYKMIAADVNKSGEITSADLVELRKLVLGKIDNFSRNTSWRFVDKAYQFTTNNPNTESFPELYTIGQLTANMTGISFVGVKVGDVNNTSLPSQLYAAEERSNKSINLTVNEREFKAGEIVEIPISNENAGELNSLQLSLGFSKGNLSFEGFANNNIQMSEENFSYLLLNQGILSASWNTNVSNKVEAGQPLFTLKFKALRSGKLSESLYMTPEGISAEATTENDEIQKVELKFIQNGIAMDSKLELYQNYPNPWDIYTQIGFNLPKPTTATIKVYDASGKLLRSISGTYQKGYNQVSLEGDDLISSGVLYYELSSPLGTATRKMVVMNK